MENSRSKLLAITAILAVYAGSCSGGGSYGGRTTPKQEPTTSKPATSCPAELACLNDPYAEKPSRWEAHKTLLLLPNFHGFNASKPVEVLEDGSVILQSSLDKNSKGWLDLKSCPKGTYAMGSYFYKNDGPGRPGVFYLTFLCRTPGGHETNYSSNIIEAVHPDSTHPSTANRALVCTGTIVGFKLHVLPSKGKDKIVDHVYPICSVDKNTDLVYLDGKAKLEPGWTNRYFCRRYQAMCQMQVQMQAKGMSNLKITCCPVQDPLKDCTPTEARVHIRTCDNSESNQGQRCQFKSKIGLSLNANSLRMEREIIFYTSVGYDFFSIKDHMKDKIISKLKIAKSTEYSWDEVDCNAEEFEVTSLKTICVKPFESVDLYQIVGQCGYFVVRTNRFVKVIKKGGVVSEEYLDF